MIISATVIETSVTITDYLSVTTSQEHSYLEDQTKQSKGTLVLKLLTV